MVETNNMEDTYNPCYVCGDVVKTKEDKYCYKPIDGVIKLRHLWHGVPGITRAVAVVCGFQGYAKTLEQAKERAEYYMSNGYAAPEVVAGEREILEEANRLISLYGEKENG